MTRLGIGDLREKVMALEWVNSFLQWTGIVLLALTFLAGFAALVVSNKLARRQDVRIAELEKGTAEAKSRAVQAEASLAQAKADAARAKQGAADANLLAAAANERAAEANKTAEGERLARLKIEARLSARVLTTEQATRL